MLINIIGSPHSGKTTLAARLFNHFKNDDLASEFITERARQYIVEKRFREKLVPGQNVYLTDSDQIAIMKAQVTLEGIYNSSCPTQTCIISDTSPLLALLYMSPEARKNPEVLEYVQTSLEMQPMVFWSRYVPGGNSLDVNRIHGPKESVRLDSEIPKLLQEFAHNLQVTEVCGSPTERYHQVLARLLRSYGVE